jgi:hypothetical protein
MNFRFWPLVFGVWIVDVVVAFVGFVGGQQSKIFHSNGMVDYMFVGAVFDFTRRKI